MKMGDGRGEHSVHMKNFKRGGICQANVAALKRVPQVCFQLGEKWMFGALEEQGKDSESFPTCCFICLNKTSLKQT